MISLEYSKIVKEKKDVTLENHLFCIPLYFELGHSSGEIATVAEYGVLIEWMYM